MDLSKTGRLLCVLRQEKGLTQRRLAEQLGVCAKTVSKWETGHGFPDVSALYRLSSILGVSVETLLRGALNPNKKEAGNVKKTKYYMCSECGSISMQIGNAQCVCCGKVLPPLIPQITDAEHAITIETVEDDYYITFEHPMEKEHHICFFAAVSYDRTMFVRLYPEQGGEVRIPKARTAKLLFACTAHGLFEAKLR